MLVARSCPTLCKHIGCSPPGCSINGILQARMLQCAAMPSSRDLPDPGTEPRSPALQADSLPSEPPRRPIFGRGDDEVQGMLLVARSLSSSVSQSGWFCLPGGHLAISGDIFCCPSWAATAGIYWVEAEGAAKLSTTRKEAPTAQNDLAPNLSGAEVEKCCLLFQHFGTAFIYDI